MTSLLDKETDTGELAVSNGGQGAVQLSTADREDIRNIAFNLAIDVIGGESGSMDLADGREEQDESYKKLMRSMKKHVRSAIGQHKDIFKDMSEKLLSECFTRNMETTEERFRKMQASFLAVADQLYADDHFNWGRLVMLYAFTDQLCTAFSDKVELSDSKTTDHVTNGIAELLACYVATRLGNWIAKEGGWEAFAACCANEETGNKLVYQINFGLLTWLGLGLLTTVSAFLVFRQVTK